MDEQIFRTILFFVPPTNNKGVGSPQTKRFEKQVKPWLQSIFKTVEFSDNQWLYGRIIYFNHEKHSARDIHNIIKPLFDTIEKAEIYKDDRQIKHFEGYRLDMQYNADYFEIELNITEEPELLRLLTETACVIEVGVLPMKPSNLVKITWL